MRQRKILVLLDRPEFERLAEVAREDEREVYQEATFLLKGLLRRMAGREPSGREACDA